MEQTALPFVSRSQPPPPSTLAPPPLETAATGTRALQRFDLGRMRNAASAPAEASDEEASEAEADAAHDNDEIAITVATMQMGVSARIKALPIPSDVIPGTAPWPRFEMPAARGAIVSARRFFPMPAPAPRAEEPFAIVRDAAWALAAAASLAVASSFASALVYLIAFP
jgi:hypothetical protein